ncbi:MAG: hypothetical protein K8R92_07465 [Planctomycetes bacterium]|nr:hypothetical protein [Planctomycetota bacterium]
MVVASAGAIASATVAPADELGQPAPASEATTKVADGGGTSLEALLQRIDSLERKNKALDTQVADLKALEGEKWLSEERAGQIRGIVEDVLADSESRSSLREDAMTAGWNDGFFLASPDGRFRLEISGFVQPAFIWSNINPPEDDPSMDQLANRYGFGSGGYNELIFKGHVFSPAIQYMIKTNVVFNQAAALSKDTANPNGFVVGSDSGQLQLLDAWARINFSDNWSMRFGQYRLPYAREQLVVDQNQMAVSRSIVSRNYGLWYSQGIEFQYQGDDLRWDLSVDNGGTDNVLGGDLLAVGSNPLNAPWFSMQSDISFNTRLEWKPYGAWNDFNSFTSQMGEQAGFLMGLAYHFQQSSPTEQYFVAPGATSFKNYWNSVTADAQWNFGGASIFASAYFNYIESQQSSRAGSFGPPPSTPQLPLGYISAYGFTFQPAIYVDPKVEIFGRYEYACWNTNNDTNLQGGPFLDQGPLSIFTAGVNWYLDGQDLKWTTDMGVTVGQAVGASYIDTLSGWRASGQGEIVFRTRLQLIF